LATVATELGGILVSQQTELVIGLVGAVGTDLTLVADELRTELREYDYSVTVLRFSDYLRDLPWAEDFSDCPEDDRIWLAMDAGTKLREETDGDALALWAISDIFAERRDKAHDGITDGDEAFPDGLQRHAWILQSLKTRDEVTSLRAVYGPRFVLFAAYSPEEKRLYDLAERIRRSRGTNVEDEWRHQPSELVQRDQDEQRAGGQDVEGTFHQADFFLDASTDDGLRNDVDRSLEVLFGHPFRTPTRDEYVQFEASGAALRSAEPSRQVGAAIATPEGSIVALGTNEVPRAGGGNVWEGDAPDNREWQVGEVETNRGEQDLIARQLAGRMREDLDRAFDASDIDDETRQVVQETFGTDLEDRLLSGKLRDLTEFGRAVHAEMDSLLDAVRRGVAVQGCTLHTTTFPCHNCARHIIAAGIKRVVFVEPYSKSRALDLHADDLRVGALPESGDDRVAFEPFRGVAPRRYLEFFSIGARAAAGQRRKDESGRIARDFDKRTARPVFSDLEPDAFRPVLAAYRRRELLALYHFEELSERLTAMEAAVLSDGPGNNAEASGGTA
jgi:deoxycytidylate deaminase